MPTAGGAGSPARWAGVAEVMGGEGSCLECGVLWHFPREGRGVQPLLSPLSSHLGKRGCEQGLGAACGVLSLGGIPVGWGTEERPSLLSEVCLPPGRLACPFLVSSPHPSAFWVLLPFLAFVLLLVWLWVLPVDPCLLLLSQEVTENCGQDLSGSVAVCVCVRADTQASPARAHAVGTLHWGVGFWAPGLVVLLPKAGVLTFLFLQAEPERWPAWHGRRAEGPLAFALGLLLAWLRFSPPLATGAQAPPPAWSPPSTRAWGRVCWAWRLPHSVRKQGSAQGPPLADVRTV